MLIDGNSFCYRAFYAIRSLVTSSGQPTNAVYGFVTMLNKLQKEHGSHYLAVAFDLKGPTFRHQRFADYKAHRKPMPDELSVQLPIIKRVLRAYKIAIFEKEGYEADDIIATLAKKLASLDTDIFIVTGDKDILQLVDSSIKVINPHKDHTIIDIDWVKERYGVAPEKIVEIIALAGDTSDNIPGVPGIGEATACELIKKFGTLDEILVNVDAMKNKSKASRIKEFSHQAQMSRELARLDLNVPQIAQQNATELLRQLKMAEPDREGLFKIFKELEFKSLMQNVAQEFKDKIQYKVVTDKEAAEKYLKEISKKSSIALYLQADQSKPLGASVLNVTFALKENECICFDLEKISLKILSPILENKNLKKVGHNLKIAKVLLSKYAINLEGLDFDTMIAAYLLNPSRLKYDLADLALEYLNCKLEETQTANIIYRLSEILRKHLKQKNLLSLFKNIEIPLVEVLADMEREGVALDKGLLLRLSCQFDQSLKSLTKEIYAMAGQDFNINSPKQLSMVLFEKLRLPKIKRTKTKGHSTDTEVLSKLSSAHPIASSLLEFREVSKLKSTYIDGLLKLLDPKTGKIHTSFNQTGTATGRLSSTGPNLQNIPIKTKLGRGIRQIFIPSKDEHLLLSADYSQIELRVLAHLSGDRNLLSAFKKDLDIHAYTASLIFGVGPDKISREMRDTAKTVNFGIIYGMSPYGLSRDLDIKQSQAQEFIDAYFQRYPGVHSYINDQITKAERDGYVTTLMQRRRYIPEINSANESIRQFAQRVAINAPVQGSASDLIKAAMVAIYRSLKAQGLSVKMIIQVHDELVFCTPRKELEQATALIKEKMENVVKLKVPIKVSIKIGKNWLEMELISSNEE